LVVGDAMRNIKKYAKKVARTFGASLSHQVNEDFFEQFERMEKGPANKLYVKVIGQICNEIKKISKRMKS
jgi:hypothetical protein